MKIRPHHSNHFRRNVDCWPEMWIDYKEQKPECDAAPDRQMCELFNMTTHSLLINPSVSHSFYSLAGAKKKICCTQRAKYIARNLSPLRCF